MRESRSSRTLRPPGCAALASDTIAEPPRFHLGYPARSFTSVTPRESTETSQSWLRRSLSGEIPCTVDPGCTKALRLAPKQKSDGPKAAAELVKLGGAKGI